MYILEREANLVERNRFTLGPYETQTVIYLDKSVIVLPFVLKFMQMTLEYIHRQTSENLLSLLDKSQDTEL